MTIIISQFHVDAIGLTYSMCNGIGGPFIECAHAHLFVFVPVNDKAPSSLLAGSFGVGCHPVKDDEVEVRHCIEDTVNTLDHNGHVCSEGTLVARARVSPTTQLGKVGVFYKLLTLRKDII